MVGRRLLCRGKVTQTDDWQQEYPNFTDEEAKHKKDSEARIGRMKQDIYAKQKQLDADKDESKTLDAKMEGWRVEDWLHALSDHVSGVLVGGGASAVADATSKAAMRGMVPTSCSRINGIACAASMIDADGCQAPFKTIHKASYWLPCICSQYIAALLQVLRQ